MSLTNILQVAIGLILVYYALGLIVNILVAIVKDALDMRAEAFEQVLRKSLETNEIGKQFVDELQEHPLIQNLKPMTNKLLQIKNRADCKVEKIPNGTFSLALVDVLASRARLTRFVRESIERLLKAEPDSDIQQSVRASLAFEEDEFFVDALRSTVGMLPDGVTKERISDLLVLLDTPEAQLQVIRVGIEELPEGKTKRALLSLLDLSKDDVNDFRRKVEAWYDDMMKNASLLFTKHVRRIVFVVSLVIAFAVGADSIEIVQDLWEQPTRQTAVTESLSRLVDEFGKGVADLRKLQTLDAGEKQEEIETQVAELVFIVDQLQSLEQVAITWRNPWPFARENWEGNVLLKLLGLFITGIATAQGSTFWYDILKRVNPQSVSSAPESDAQASTAQV